MSAEHERVSTVKKYGIRDIVDVADVNTRTEELRATLLAAVGNAGMVILPYTENVQVLEPMAEDDGRLTQEIRVSVLAHLAPDD
jgi:hypothetical protein